MSPFQTNNPPTDNEATLARKALAKSLGTISLIDSEINHLQDRLDILSLEQRQLHASLETCRGLLSPIRRLLPDILQEVFRHCLPTAHNAVMSATEAPLVLGRVCSQWRQVAYSTPELWASVHIVATVQAESSDSQERAVALRHAISAWLSRSGALPLSISLVVRELGSYQLRGFAYAQGDLIHTCNDKVQPYLDILAAYVHRWRSIHFTIYCFHWMGFFSRFHASDVPLLESLHIDGDNYNDSGQQNVIPTLSRPNNILQAPRLHVLSIPPYFKHIPEFGIQLRNITGINIGRSCLLRVEEVTRVLALCPNLRTCTTPIWVGLPRSIEVPAKPTTLPKLQSLAILEHPSGQYGRMLRNLRTPALRHLLLPPPKLPSRRDVLRHDRPYDSLDSFLRHLIDPLQELDLSSRGATSGEKIVGILSLVPHLKRLSLSGCRDSSRVAQEGVSEGSRGYDPVLAQLTPSDDWREGPGLAPDDESSQNDVPTCLCPKLEVLRYVGAGFSDDELLDFLRSRTTDHRKHNVSRLRIVDVQVSRRERDDVREVDLRKNIEAIGKETSVRVRVDYEYYGPQVFPENRERPANSRYSPFDGICRSKTGSGFFLF